MFNEKLEKVVATKKKRKGTIYTSENSDKNTTKKINNIYHKSGTECNSSQHVDNEKCMIKFF